MTNRKRASLVAISLGALAAIGISGSIGRGRLLPPPHLILDPSRILADGYERATLTIEGETGGTPAVSVIGNPHAVTMERMRGAEGKWQAAIHAGILPGRVRLKVAVAGAAPAEAELELLPFARDSAGDGTPDFLRLDDERDQKAFRRWFTFLAEAQYFQPAAGRPAEIKDCAAFIRYAYREALHAHDSAWAVERQGSCRRRRSIRWRNTNIRYTPLGAALLRVRAGRIPPGRSGGWSVRAIRGRADLAAVEYSLGEPRAFRSRAGRSAVLPAGVAYGTVSQHDLSRAKPDSGRWQVLRPVSHRARRARIPGRSGA